MASVAWGEQITWAQGGSRTLLLMGWGSRKNCDGSLLWVMPGRLEHGWSNARVWELPERGPEPMGVKQGMGQGARRSRRPLCPPHAGAVGV